ncbi:apolipoprotein D-like [Mizuhopecten yessoensis]|uniref:Apolipoprotein D n=1 Tax=Mizuhopecten yessoensis TaxID=6573 RepID=A0A210PNR3_MIZYE|nr:apolipoprotein D-like [Mizuhopecten yessoensis]OWF38108.1 Apolipoprotein D [Mizuhopecten yessoensis]
MMSLALFLATLLAVLGLAPGQVVRGTCPTVDTQPDFNITQYLGDWVEDRKFTTLFELGLTCVKANYALLDNGNIQVTNSGIRPFTRTQTIASAIATVPDPSEPGRLSISFDADRPSGSYLVLDTDYDNYSLVYSCQNFFGLFSAEFAWILKRSRGYQLTASQEAKLYSKLNKYNINPRRFVRVFEPFCSQR